MKRAAGRNHSGKGRTFKALVGREKRHDCTGMTDFDSDIRRRTIRPGLHCANREGVGLDRPEIGGDMQDARHGNGDHAGNPDQEPEVTKLHTESVVEHSPLEATVDFASMT